MEQWVECQTANQVAQVRSRPTPMDFFLSVFLTPGGSEPILNCSFKRNGPVPWCGDQKTGSMSRVPDTEISPVRQDTDVAPGIGRANHDCGCSPNADSKAGATSSGPENREPRKMKYSVCKRRELFKKTCNSSGSQY